MPSSSSNNQLGDPVVLIRRLRALDPARRPVIVHLVSNMVAMLVALNAAPIKVDSRGAWWIIQSGADWLMKTSGEPNLEHFHRIVAFPAAGQNCHRVEIDFTAFCEAVLTVGGDGVSWIKGQQTYGKDVGPLLDGLDCGTGRMIVFLPEAP